MGLPGAAFYISQFLNQALMKSSIDNYNLSQPPPDLSPGFVFFQGEGDGQFYFYFNAPAGNTLFFSEGYESEKSRNAGHNSVLKNASITQRYTTIKKEPPYFFILKAGNHKEIGRSCNFDSVEQANLAMEWFSRNVNKKTASFEAIKWSTSTIKNAPSKVTTKVPSSRSITVEEARAKQQQAKAADTASKGITVEHLPINPVKYHFRIDLYPDTQSGVIRGKIEDVLTNEKLSFVGLDDETIMQFIKDNISEQDRQLLFEKMNDAASSRQPVTVTSVAQTGQRGKISIAQELDNMSLELKPDKVTNFKRHLLKSDTFSVVLRPNEGLNSRFIKGDFVDMLIKINSIDKNEPFSKDWNVDVLLDNETEVVLPRTFSIPQTGIFRVQAIAKSNKQRTLLTGSTLVNVV
jgi:uncharacterized protein YegP (UPF0339 family)